MARKQLPILENLEIIDIGSEGQSVAKTETLVVFVNGAVPGDIVDVQLTQKKKNFAVGNPVNYRKFSDKRTEAFCKHFGTCGGCKWQHFNYSEQLFYKQKQVEESLRRIGKLEFPKVTPILGSKEIKGYRNKLEFAFTNKRWLYDFERGTDDTRPQGSMNALGFHIPGRFDKVFNVEECHLMNDVNNRIRNSIKEYALKHHLTFFDLKNQEGFLRTLMVRNTSGNQWMVVLAFHHEDIEKREALLNYLVQEFPEITSLFYTINTKRNDSLYDQDLIVYKGNPYIIQEIEGLKFKIHPKSFFQTNTDQTYTLYKAARDLANLQGHELVYDLYTGTGTIANFVAKKAKKVIGIEYIEQAIIDARENAALNGITNTVFYAGDMKDVLTPEFIAQNGKPEVIITDPPRAGMHEEVVKRIAQIKAPKVVYVSCNPATQARDLALLNELYKIEAVQPVDMFPHTHHVENIVLLKLRQHV